VVEFSIRLLAPVAKDGFSRFRRQFLATLPVPSASARERDRIVDLASRRQARELDERVARLFRIERHELATMKAYLEARSRGNDA
jgi:hypothetical protein